MFVRNCLSKSKIMYNFPANAMIPQIFLEREISRYRTKNRLNRLITKRLASSSKLCTQATTIRVSKKKFEARAEFEAV